MLVNTATENAQNGQQITALSNGGFVITWVDSSVGVGGATGDSSGSAIKAQVYAADGSGIGTELLVNTATQSTQNAEQITALSNGGFVVTWVDFSVGNGGATGDNSGSAIKAQIYAADGSRIGAELLVNTATVNSQNGEQITALSNGGFVITWADLSAGVGGATGDISSAAVKAQVYAADGSRIGGELLVNTATANSQNGEHITALSNGGFVVTWVDNSAGAGGATGDTISAAIKAQIYAADGSRVGGELLVNTATAGAQNAEQITALANGGFVITWADGSFGVGGDTGDSNGTAIKVQAFAADGTRIGSEMLANSARFSDQNAPQIKGLSNGGFVVTWTDNSQGAGGNTGDGSGLAVKAQVFSVGSTVAPIIPATEQTDASLKGHFNVTDVDAGSGQVTATIAAAYGILVADAGSSGVTVAGSGTSTLTVTGTLTQLNLFLSTTATNTLAYNANTDAPPASTTLTLTIDDGGNTGSGGAMTASNITTITIAPVNDAPAIDLDSTAPGSGVFATALEGQPVAVAPNAAVSDSDSANFDTGSLTVTYGAAATANDFVSVRDQGGQFSAGRIGVNGNTIYYDTQAIGTFTTGLGQPLVVTFNANATSPAVSALLREVLTGNISDTPPAGTRALTFTVNDGDGAATSVTADVTIQAVNDAPTVTITPGTLAKSGNEFLVNTATTGSQAGSAVTPLSGGGFVITWTDASIPAESNNIKAQLFNAAGVAVGGEILVNTVVAGNQDGSSVARLSSGGFVVSWNDFSGQGGDASSSGIKAQIFDSVGGKVGSEFLVNTQTSNQQSGVNLVSLPTGGFLATWNDSSLIGGDTSASGIKAQFFNAAGAKVGGEVLVNTTINGFQLDAKAAMLSSGRFVVTWNHQLAAGGDGSASSLKAQIIDATGTKVGSEFQVNTSTTSDQYSQNITALVSGGFVVTWRDDNTAGDGSNSSIKAQIFDAAGVKVGGEFVANTTTASFQIEPDVTALPSGGFVVAWQDSSNQGGDATPPSIKAQAFDAAGVKVGAQFLVNTVTAGSQLNPAVTTLTSGSVLVTWADQSGQGGDTDVSGVKAQIFAPQYLATEQTALSLKGGVAVADVDVGGGVLTATLSVGYGLLNLAAGTSGATIVSGNGTGAVVISGTLAQLNALLTSDATSTITFTANTDTPPTSATLTVTVDDGGNTGMDPGLTGTANSEAGSASTTIAITPVNDAPGGTDATINVRHGVLHVLTAAEFGFGDVENNAFVSVTVTTTPTAGRLLYSLGGGAYQAVTAGQVITTADIFAGKLVYKPTPGVNDASTGSFTFQVHDNGGTANGGIDTDQSPNTLTFTVPPNLAPDGHDATIAVTHGIQHVLTTGEFGFSDPDGYAFAAVTITTGPTAGRLLYGMPDGHFVGVTAGQVITTADIDAGRLIYKPTPGANDPAIGSFTFQVHDDGGTTNGGVDTDPTPNTLTFDANAGLADRLDFTAFGVAAMQTAGHHGGVIDLGDSEKLGVTGMSHVAQDIGQHAMHHFAMAPMVNSGNLGWAPAHDYLL